ncbi:hypothetical protein PIB30_078554, partial [Stylosanthes scabra]|nr:hypothetical protein [Stylosanthes scabra]
AGSHPMICPIEAGGVTMCLIGLGGRNFSQCILWVEEPSINLWFHAAAWNQARAALCCHSLSFTMDASSVLNALHLRLNPNQFQRLKPLGTSLQR